MKTARVMQSAARSLGITERTFKRARQKVGVPVLERDRPVLTTSIKRDIVDATLRRRRELGDVKVFDPLGPGLYGRGELWPWSASDQDRARAKALQHERERGITELSLDKAEGLR